MSYEARTCPHCGKEAEELSDTQAWCYECCSTGEIIVDNINSGDESEVAV